MPRVHKLIRHFRSTFQTIIEYNNDQAERFSFCANRFREIVYGKLDLLLFYGCFDMTSIIRESHVLNLLPCVCSANL